MPLQAGLHCCRAVLPHAVAIQHPAERLAGLAVQLHGVEAAHFAGHGPQQRYQVVALAAQAVNHAQRGSGIAGQRRVYHGEQVVAGVVQYGGGDGRHGDALVAGQQLQLLHFLHRSVQIALQPLGQQFQGIWIDIQARSLQALA